MDWEIELGFVIGTKAQKVSRETALSHVAGYCLANDVSERDWQTKRSGQWVKGKSFDTFGPLGPWLVTSDELSDPQTVPLSLKVNGVQRQKNSTSDMIFSVAEIVSHLSQFMTLLPGDVVVTGTPEGVGLGMKPPVFLKRGDVIELDGGNSGCAAAKGRLKGRAANASDRANAPVDGERNGRMLRGFGMKACAVRRAAGAPGNRSCAAARSLRALRGP